MSAPRTRRSSTPTTDLRSPVAPSSRPPPTTIADDSPLRCAKHPGGALGFGAAARLDATPRFANSLTRVRASDPHTSVTAARARSWEESDGTGERVELRGDRGLGAAARRLRASRRRGRGRGPGRSGVPDLPRRSPDHRLRPQGQASCARGARGEFTYRTHGITVDPDGMLYCTDDGNHTIRKFTPDGKLLMTTGHA